MNPKKSAKNFIRELKRWGGYLRTAALTTWVVCVVGWIGDGLKGESLFLAWVNGVFGMSEEIYRARHLHWLMLGGSLLLLVASLWFGRNVLSRLGGVGELASISHTPASAMVALLTKTNHTAAVVSDGCLNITVNHFGSITPWSWPLDQPIASVVADFEARSCPWNLLPLLSSISKHGQQLSIIVLQASSVTKESADDVIRVFKEIMPRTDLIIRSGANYPDFSNLDFVRRDITGELNSLTRKSGLSPDNIVINVTGGIKTAGIAAAVAAMDHGSSFEYVEGRTLHTYSISAQHLHSAG